MISSRLNVLAVQHPIPFEIRTVFRKQMLKPLQGLVLRKRAGCAKNGDCFQNEKLFFHFGKKCGPVKGDGTK